MINNARKEREQHSKRWWNTEFYFENAVLKDWHIYFWEVFVILFFMFIIMLFNQIPYWGETKYHIVDGAQKIDFIHSYELNSKFPYMTFSLFVSIGISIFIGIFTEMGQYAGKFGSALFVLVPSFLWLFSDRGSDSVDELLAANKMIINNGFYISIASLGIMGIMQAIRFIVIFASTNKWTVIKTEFWISYINRLLIILANIVMVLMLGTALLNYAISALDLAKIPDDQKLPNGSFYDFQAENVVKYIAFVAILFAGIMVAIGVVSGLGDKEIKKYQRRLAHSTRKLYTNSSYFTGEFGGIELVNTNKKPWYLRWMSLTKYIGLSKTKKTSETFYEDDDETESEDDYKSENSNKPKGSLYKEFWAEEGDD